MSSANSIDSRLRWLPFLINTAVLYALAPVAFWGAFCVSAGQVDLGVGLASLFGLAGTYLAFGFSLLVVCVGTTAVVSRLARLHLPWQRAISGVLAGVAVGVLMGGYMALKLAADAAAIDDSPTEGQGPNILLLSPAAGGVLGVALPWLWRLSCFFAHIVSRVVAEPAIHRMAAPAEPVNNSSASDGPPSVS